MLKFRFRPYVIRGPTGPNHQGGFTTSLVKETRHRHDWNGSGHPVPNEKGALEAPFVEDSAFEAPHV